LPIIESYYFNKLALASDVCAIPEVILDNEHLFQNNLESLFSRVINAKELTQKSKFRKYFNDRFSSDDYEKFFSVIYEKG